MTNSGLYRVIFYGEIAEGQSANAVKQKLATMFKLSAKLIDETFAGHPLVIKSQIDQQTALKYKAAFERTGALCRVEPLQQTKKPSRQPAQQQSRPVRTQQKTARPPQQKPVQGTAPVPQQPKPSGSAQRHPKHPSPQNPARQQSKPTSPAQRRQQQQAPASARQPAPQQASIKPQQPPPASAPERYNIVFKGEIAQGSNLESVKRNVAAVFQINSSQVAALFTGKPVVVKEKVDRQTALQYKTAFERAGAICQIAPISAVVQHQSAPPPLPQAAGATGVESPKPGMMTCPKCGFEQKESLRCSRCGIFIKNYLKAQQQNKEDHQQFQEGMEEEEYAHELREFEEDLEIERQEAISVIEATSSWLFIFAVGSVIGAIFWGWLEIIDAIILAVLASALRWFHSRTAAILTFVVSLFYLIVLVFTILTLPIGLMLRTGILIYTGIRCISKTFQLHGDLADPNQKPSQLAYLVEAGLILSVVVFFGFVGYQVYKVTRVVTTTFNEFGDLAEQFEAMSQFWQQLPDGSFVYVELEPWPIPAGEQVTMHVWTSAGENKIKNVKQVDYLLTFSVDGFGEFTEMELKESSAYDDMWEATVVVNTQEPFLRLRFVTTTTHGTVDLDGMKLSFK